ncbi:MAG TPA: thiamine phosphate synthase [Terriglobales bacterium]|jgi:thiamine-phosphate pyrophosphorylase|nr:thiamine phosphate synthase [Terriglobales bacterium]
MKLPKLYAIVDVSCFAPPLRTTASILDYARDLAAGGAMLIQYRNKVSSTREMLTQAREIRHTLDDTVRLIMNDRADICIAADFQGAHVGQDDLSPEGARTVIGDDRILGVSTHNLEQLLEADAGPGDYIAFGPVFKTSSKRNPDPVVGLDGIRAARAATKKPLVAIGGITRANARSLIDAGADSVAVIADLLSAPAKNVEEFLQLLV